MAKIIRFDREMSLEEFVIAEVCANYGTQTRVTVPVLKHILDIYEIPYKKNVTKEEMLRQLYEYFKDWNKVAKEVDVGVKVNQYLDAFPFLTRQDVKRLEKFDVLKVIGYQKFRAFGKAKYAPLYDLEQFLNMTEEQLQQYLKEYPKGKRKSYIIKNKEGLKNGN